MNILVFQLSFLPRCLRQQRSLLGVGFALLSLFCPLPLAAEPITHTVFFSLQQGIEMPEENFRQEALELAKIPGVKHFRWVTEISPKNTFDHGLVMVFENQTAYDAYNVHPDHVHFVEHVWMPNVADFMEVDWIEEKRASRPQAP